MTSVRKAKSLTVWLMNKPGTTGALVFLLLLIFIGLITKQRYYIIKENERQEMISVLNVVKQNVEQTLKNSYTTALTLALTINDNGKADDFDRVAAKLIDSNSNFQAVQLVPDGIIRYVYPLKGNEGALGANVFKITPEHTMRAYQAVRSRKMYFTGPNRLRQGGIGIIGRLPIFNEDQFWGFSAVVIKLNTFLKDVGIVNDSNKKFIFQFSRYNIASKKEEFFLPEITKFNDLDYEYTVIPDGNWRIYLIAKNRFDISQQIMYPFLFGLSLALLCSLLITKLLKKHIELQAVADDQATKLIETEIKFKTIFDEAAIGIALVNTVNGQFLQVNKKLCKILGYTEKELSSLKLEDVRSSEDHSVISAEQKGLYPKQTRYADKHGNIKWANIVETPLQDEEGNFDSSILILEDVTELNSSIKLVTEQNKRLLNFSYIVSHNLRSHTSNIQAIVGLIEKSASEIEIREMVSLLRTVSDSLNETMINLNNVVNIQTNLDIVTTSLSLHDYITNTLNVLSDQINIKAAQVINNVSSDTFVVYNPAYLESILLNFISNAIRYSHPDRKPLIMLSIHREEEQLVLEVTDNGIGIDLNKYGDDLFGMYKTFTGNVDSKGIGLFISKNQIDAMGGRVTVHSICDEGTTFKIYFR
ncbi:MAG TPA: ATP-binding protein [Pedobacter sp.]|nr:ATP-binding protein [Pedobacter sp.]